MKFRYCLKAALITLTVLVLYLYPQRQKTIHSHFKGSERLPQECLSWTQSILPVFSGHFSVVSLVSHHRLNVRMEEVFTLSWWAVFTCFHRYLSYSIWANY